MITKMLPKNARAAMMKSMPFNGVNEISSVRELNISDELFEGHSSLASGQSNLPFKIISLFTKNVSLRRVFLMSSSARVVLVSQ